MKTIDIHDATVPLADYAHIVNIESVIMTSHGKPLIDVEDVNVETIALSTNPEFLAIIQHSRRHQGQEGGISSEEMRRRLGVLES